VSTHHTRIVAPSDGGRLDRVIADATGCGRRRAREWILAGRVTVDGHVARGADRPRPGADIRVPADAEAIPATDGGEVVVLVEEPQRIVLSTPAGLHCERGRRDGSVAAFLEHRYGTATAIGDRAEEAGLVHRIDRDTSGIVIAARTREEYLHLRSEFSRGEAEKHYLAIVVGRLHAALEIDVPLARRARGVVVAGRHDDALAAFTDVFPLEQGEDWTLVLAAMRTGVTHQVRAHLASVGHPLVGDVAYGGPVLEGCPRKGQLLHASRVKIPASKIDVSATAPGDFLAGLAQLRSG
jgi:23S rRNA pseudouridine1911/1915/1917 synthase